MRTLIVEDEFTSRMQMKFFLEDYGPSDSVENGDDAVMAFKMAHSRKKPYDLICLDVKLPGKDGLQVLTEIKVIEKAIEIPISENVKVFMITAMNDVKFVKKAYHELCDEYLTKPVEKVILDKCLKAHKLIP